MAPSYASSDRSRHTHKKGRGKPSNFMGDAAFAPTTEQRIPIDVTLFPHDSNIIMQLLGPRGRHQQRMKNESDAIVTTSGKGVRGNNYGTDEPLVLIIRSKDPAIPLTPRQIAVVHQIYEDILRHVNEFGNSDNAAQGPLNILHITPASLMEFLWNLHTLLSRPRAQDLMVDQLFDAYLEMFGQECPIQSWLVVDPNSGGVRGALSRIPHIVELYEPAPKAPTFMRAANPPDVTFSQLREVDDGYKIRLQQIAAGHIPIEDFADASGITGMLFGNDRVSACVNILQGIVKVLSEKARMGTSGMDLSALESEFQELFKVPLDVFHLVTERSLLQFLVKFRTLFNVYHDGISWKILLVDGWDTAASTMDSLVKATILVQPKPRRVVRLCSVISAFVQQHAAQEQIEASPDVASGSQVEKPPTQAPGAQGDSIAALVSMLQGFQKQPSTTAESAGESSNVTAQIQQLLQKKKQQSEPSASTGASGTALNELMAALQAAKQPK